MKKAFWIIASMVGVMACKNQTKAPANTDTAIVKDMQTAAAASKEETTTAPSATALPLTAFDINSIPVSDKLNGNFPYFKLPGGYVFTNPNQYNGTGKTKDYDKEYFFVHGSYWPVEGKTYKAVIRVDDQAKDKTFSTLEIQKSFDDLIAQLGGVKLNNNEKLKEGEDKKLEPDALTNGYLHSCNNWENVHTYVIHKSDRAIWVQYNLGQENSDITVLETTPFKNQMGISSATEIKQQLDEKGKAVLYINFDTDKASLKPDGVTAVAEIATVLTQNPTLKLSINGYTDNTGTVQHNKQLSTDRAQTVLNSLVAKGIPAANLKAAGYGAENPLAENSSEENKAKNRRVELVKV